MIGLARAFDPVGYIAMGGVPIRATDRQPSRYGITFDHRVLVIVSDAPASRARHIKPIVGNKPSKMMRKSRTVARALYQPAFLRASVSSALRRRSSLIVAKRLRGCLKSIDHHGADVVAKPTKERPRAHRFSPAEVARHTTARPNDSAAGRMHLRAHAEWIPSAPITTWPSLWS